VRQGILRAASDWRGITWTLHRLKVQAVELDVDVMLENGRKVKRTGLSFKFKADVAPMIKQFCVRMQAGG
jgi:hypothetical protein